MIYKDFRQLLSIDSYGRNIVVQESGRKSSLYVLAENDYLAQFCGSTLRISLLDCDVILNISKQKTFSISQFIAKQLDRCQRVSKFEFISGEQEQPSQKQKFSNKSFSFKYMQNNDVCLLSLSLSKIVKNQSELNNILFVYKLSKYIRLTQFKQDDDYFETAIKMLLQFIKKNITDSVLALLISYTTENSQIFSEDDIIAYFGQDVNEIVKKLNIIETIVDSNAKITQLKRQKYRKEFSENIISIKAALVIAYFQVSNLDNVKSYPIKVHKRYMPIFSAYPNVSEFVSNKLKKWLIRQVNKHYLQNKSGSMPKLFDTHEMLKYYSIVK
jgi:hypothetical protein